MKIEIEPVDILDGRDKSKTRYKWNTTGGTREYYGTAELCANDDRVEYDSAAPETSDILDELIIDAVYEYIHNPQEGAR